MPQRDVGRARRRFTEPTVAVATLLGQFFIYALNMVATRALGPGRFGELAALLTVTVILAIPALALQSWTARAAATTGDARGLLPTTTGLALACSALTFGIVLVSAPHLNTEGVPAAASTALLVLPMVWLAAAQGLLQGHERLYALGGVILLSGFARFVGGAVALVIGLGPWSVVWGIGLATLLVAGVAWAVALRQIPTVGRPTQFTPVMRIAAATGAMWTVSNLDVVVARLALEEHDSGLYAAGALIARATQFAPNFVLLAAFAALTDPHRTRAVLVRSFLKVTAVGLAAIALLAVAGQRIVPLVFGPDFDYVGRWAWLFAVLGTLLALNQLLVTQRVARHDERVAVAAWVAAGALPVVVLGVLGHSVLQVLAAGLAINVVLLLVLVARVATHDRVRPAVRG